MTNKKTENIEQNKTGNILHDSVGTSSRVTIQDLFMSYNLSEINNYVEKSENKSDVKLVSALVGFKELEHSFSNDYSKININILKDIFYSLIEIKKEWSENKTNFDLIEPFGEIIEKLIISKKDKFIYDLFTENFFSKLGINEKVTLFILLNHYQNFIKADHDLKIDREWYNKIFNIMYSKYKDNLETFDDILIDHFLIIDTDEHKRFNNLDEALDFINNVSNKEGEIPKEEEPNWYITTLSKLSKIEPFKKFDEEFKDMDPKIKLEVIDSVMKEQREKLEKKSEKKKSLFESLYLND